MDDSKLRPHTVRLCEELDLDKLLPYLRQERMVTNNEYETVTNMGYTKRERRAKLLLMMPRKGHNYFENFGKCLVWSGQTELARHIGVDVDNVPPSPYQFGANDDDPYGNEAMRNQALLHALQNIISSNSAGGGPPPSYHSPSVPSTTSSSLLIRSERLQGSIGYCPPTAAVADPPYQSGDGILTTRMHTEPPRKEIHPVHPTKVFILYCKDKLLESTHGVTANDFSKDVLQLADILSSFSSIFCSVDFYENEYQSNWNIWTQKQIDESKFVVMISSPQLFQHLSTGEHTDVDMEKGRFFSDTVINIIKAPKFIPVFLNGFEPRSGNLREWLPPQLHMASPFQLRNIRDFYDAVRIQDTDQLSERLSQYLQDPKYDQLVHFIRYLCGEHCVDRPMASIVHVPVPIPKKNFSVPSRHMAGQPQRNPSSAASQAEGIPEADFLKIARRLPREWPHLGIKLGVEYSTIERLRQKHRSDSVAAALEMFVTWKELKGKSATRKALKKALVDLQFGRLASELYPTENI